MKTVTLHKTIEIGRNITVRYCGEYRRDATLKNTVHAAFVLTVEINGQERSRGVGQHFVVPFRNDHLDDFTVEMAVKAYLKGLVEGVECAIQFLPDMPAKAPWLATLILPGIANLTRDDIQWIGDFEKCMAATILSR